MSDTEFFVSSPGRIACVTGFVALAAPGAMALAGPSPNDVAYGACVLMACTLGCMATAILASHRFMAVTLAIAFFTPLIGGFYVAAMSFVATLGASVGWTLTALALLPLATMFAAPFRSREGLRPLSRSGKAHAHA